MKNVKRIIVIVFALAAIVVIIHFIYEPRNHPVINPPASQDQNRPSREDLEHSILAAAQKSVQEHRLVALPEECLLYSLEKDSSAVYTVDVYENHNDPKCAGDPLTTPRLFSIEVSKDLVAVGTDIDSTDGQFKPFR
jgi:hypothetical protein